LNDSSSFLRERKEPPPLIKGEGIIISLFDHKTKVVYTVTTLYVTRSHMLSNPRISWEEKEKEEDLGKKERLRHQKKHHSDLFSKRK